METFLIVLAVIALSWRPGAMRAAEPVMPVLEMEPADEEPKEFEFTAGSCERLRWADTQFTRQTVVDRLDEQSTAALYRTPEAFLRLMRLAGHQLGQYPRRGDRGVSRAARDYHFSSCLPVRNLRRYFLGRSIEASMIGPAERLWPLR